MDKTRSLKGIVTEWYQISDLSAEGVLVIVRDRYEHDYGYFTGLVSGQFYCQSSIPLGNPGSLDSRLEPFREWCRKLS